jgi:hypothetical protein
MMCLCAMVKLNLKLPLVWALLLLLPVLAHRECMACTLHAVHCTVHVFAAPCMWLIVKQDGWRVAYVVICVLCCQQLWALHGGPTFSCECVCVCSTHEVGFTGGTGSSLVCLGAVKVG